MNSSYSNELYSTTQCTYTDLITTYASHCGYITHFQILLLVIVTDPHYMLNILLGCLHVLGVVTTLFLSRSQYIVMADGNIISNDKALTYIQLFTWYLMASHLFFSTGHQYTFSTIQWNAGVIGDFQTNLLLSGVLIFINTFISHILFATSLPLLVSYYYYLGKKGGKIELSTTHALHFFNVLFRSIYMYIFFYGMQVLMTCAAAAIHRRHLMAYTIFAPRVLFDVAAFMAASIGVFFGTFMVWLHAANNHEFLL